MSSTVLSASVRQNLLSLQSTADLLATTQTRLSSGKKVNSALDNPTGFFTASGLTNRAGDLTNLLDDMGQAVKTLEAGWGLDAATGEYVDMIKAGIIDPAKVTRSALQNAASIAGLFLTTEAVVADKPEKEKAPAMPGGGGDMDF